MNITCVDDLLSMSRRRIDLVCKHLDTTQSINFKLSLGLLDTNKSIPSARAIHSHSSSRRQQRSNSKNLKNLKKKEKKKLIKNRSREGIDDRYKTIICHNYHYHCLNENDEIDEGIRKPGQCPYQHRCHFIHGEHWLELNALRSFRCKKMLYASSP